MPVSVAELFLDIERWGTPILSQTLNFYIEKGEKLLALEMEPREYAKECKHCIKAVKKELEFARRIALFKDSMGDLWKKARSAIDSVLNGCTFKLGLFFIEKLPDLTKGLGGEFAGRRSEIALEILEKLAELSGEVGKKELSKAEINRTIKRFGYAPDSGESVKVLEEGKVCRAEVIEADAEDDCFHIKIEGGLEKKVVRGGQIFKPRKLPKTGDFCSIAEGPQANTAGFVESCDRGIATVRCLPLGDSIEIELIELDKISHGEAGATDAFLKLLERAQTAEGLLSEMVVQETQDPTEIPSLPPKSDGGWLQDVRALDSARSEEPIGTEFAPGDLVKISPDYNGTQQFRGLTASFVEKYGNGMCQIEFDRPIEIPNGNPRQKTKIDGKWLSLESRKLAGVGF